MSTNKRIREMTGFLQSHQCEVVVVKSKRHVKSYAKKMGNEKMFVTSASPSDIRSSQNIHSQFKRWLRTIETGAAL